MEFRVFFTCVLLFVSLLEFIWHKRFFDQLPWCDKTEGVCVAAELWRQLFWNFCHFFLSLMAACH